MSGISFVRNYGYLRAKSRHGDASEWRSEISSIKWLVGSLLKIYDIRKCFKRLLTTDILDVWDLFVTAIIHVGGIV